MQEEKSFELFFASGRFIRILSVKSASNLKFQCWFSCKISLVVSSQIGAQS